jgi:hypothetical protein
LRKPEGKAMQTQKSERFFSIELNTKNQIKTLTLAGGGQKEAALIEGSIGAFVGAAFVEGVMLEVVGTEGTLRLDLKADEIKTKTTGGQ